MLSTTTAFLKELWGKAEQTTSERRGKAEPVISERASER